MPEIEVGKIVNTHGLRGDFKVEPWCDGIEVYEYLDKVYIKGTPYEIESVKPFKNLFLLKLKGIDDINEAEKYKSFTLYAMEEDMPPLPDGVYYLKDIIGVEVYEDVKYLGKIYDWIETGSNNVYVVKRPEGKDLLFPAIDEFIKEIDMENKKMHVKLLEGMVVDDN